MSDDQETPCPNCGAANPPEAQRCRQCGRELAPQGAQAVSALSREIDRVTDPLLALGGMAPRELIGTSIQQILASAGPKQADVLRRAAIPRWFDEGVLGVLRERDDGNDRVLELLRGYSFVRPMDLARYAYHDEVREALLDEWRRDDAEEFAQINRDLALYFGDLAASLAPATPSPRGPAQQTVRVAVSGAWDIYRREALYHQLAADQHAGMEALLLAFDEAEAEHQLGEAEALLQIPRDIPLGESCTYKLHFMRARFEKASLALDQAELHLSELLRIADLDAMLRAQVQQALGEIYVETARWVQATEIYHRARATYEELGSREHAAEIWRLLGEAYQALGASTGGWHVPAYPRNLLLRGLAMLWDWLMSLPFYPLLLVIRAGTEVLPRPRYFASYQNWTLIWLFRAALSCYERAMAAFRELGDDVGMLRTERQVADIVRKFGYPERARALLASAKARPAAQDAHTRAWLDVVVAKSMIDQGRRAEAGQLIGQLIAIFREQGDFRLEAVSIGMQAQLLADAQDYEQSLARYRECLAYVRRWGYVVGREQLLYHLRMIRRRVGPGDVAQQIAAMLAAEPEKQYVARFPNSQLPLLRVLSVIALPMAMLVMAVFAPSATITRVAQLATLQVTFDPLRGLVVLLALLVLYGGIYALVAVGVISFVALGDLSREQPDLFVTDHEGIAYYNARGELSQHFRWRDVGRWLRIERKLWGLPMALLSGAFLENRAGDDMHIEGITGWFTSLQEDIDTRLQAMRSPVEPEHYGFVVLRSRAGATAAAGMVLLSIFLADHTSGGPLSSVLPAPIYVSLALLAFSGLLIVGPVVYWVGIMPMAMRRVLGIRDYFPFAAVAAGGLMVAAGLLGMVPLLRPLNIGLAVGGAAVAAYALAQLAQLPRHLIRAAVVAAVAAAAAGYVAIQGISTYNLLISQVEAERALDVLPDSMQERAAGAAIQAGDRVLNNSDTTTMEQAQAYLSQGNAYYAVGDYDRAWEAYTQALGLYDRVSGDQATKAKAAALYNRYIVWKMRGGRPNTTDAVNPDLREACKLAPQISTECVFIQAYDDGR